MEDLAVLEEMEYNGFKYDVELSLKMGRELEQQIKQIDKNLTTYCPNVPISFNSDQQLSAFLYGGCVVREEQETYTFTYKDGHTAPKQRWIKKEYPLPRILTPLENSGKKKDGVYSVDVTTLKIIKRQINNGFKTKIINMLLKRSQLEKKKSTYCYGTPKLMAEMNWENSLLHPQLNQVVAVTGRLSCSKPNLQNQEYSMQRCFISRFPINE